LNDALPLSPTPDVWRVRVAGVAAVTVMFYVPSKFTPLIARYVASFVAYYAV